MSIVRMEGTEFNLPESLIYYDAEHKRDTGKPVGIVVRGETITHELLTSKEADLKLPFHVEIQTVSGPLYVYGVDCLGRQPTVSEALSFKKERASRKYGEGASEEPFMTEEKRIDRLLQMSDEAENRSSGMSVQENLLRALTQKIPRNVLIAAELGITTGYHKGFF